MNGKTMMNTYNKQCPKSGIKIHHSNNDTRYIDTRYINQYEPNDLNIYKQSKLTKPVSYQNTTLDSLDLDLENYSLEDLFHLFNIAEGYLTEDSLKNAKQIVLKMHPDKSRLDSKYFLFFSKAYKRIYSIYEFQNKSTNTSKKNFDTQYFDESNKAVLDNMFEKNKEFKDPKNFNSWFNDAFEKHRIDNPHDNGYGDWLKSNEGFISVDENVTKGNMNDIFEQKKRHIQSVIKYEGVQDMFASSLGGSLLDDEQIGSTENYTDLRQAYTETLIPVTNDDYNKMQKFNNISEYKAHRERVDIKPISKEEAERKLYLQQQQYDKHSSALAFKYAKEAERAKEKQNDFWSGIKQITGW